MKPSKSLRSRALDILSRRETSRAELKRKLTPYAESEAQIDELIAEFAEHNWQSDTRFAEAYIHSKSPRHGRLKLKQALCMRGVDPDVFTTLLPGRDEELAAAITLLQKKFGAAAVSPADKLKQTRFLVYRGFDADTICHALHRAWADE